ncbi:MAG: hypothetical protein RLZZ352_1175 [Pseudomonadota bacterium]
MLLSMMSDLTEIVLYFAHALHDGALDSGDDLGRGVKAGVGHLIQYGTVALMVNAGEHRHW